jgi:hypothetical protein
MFVDPEAGHSDQQGTNFNETAVLNLGDGEMLAMARADECFHSGLSYMPVGGVGYFRTARSFNWGLSWTRPERTKIFGQPAHLLQVDKDTVICTYGVRRKPFGIHAVISRDRGRTWATKKPIVLRDDAQNWDMGYPATIRRKDGKFFTIYYFVDKNNTRFIAGTIWSLP